MLKIKKLKAFYSLVIATFFINISLAQTIPVSEPAYKRIPQLPPFKLYTAPDSLVFTKDELKKKKATVIIIFSPTCEHCVEETKELKEKIGLFKKAQIVMVSPLEYSYLRQFYDDNKIADYPTITMGRDPGYFLGVFTKCVRYPRYLYIIKRAIL